MDGHVLYIGGFELPDKNAAAHRVLANGKALRECGCEVTFIGVSKEHGECFSHAIDTGHIQGFRTFAISYPSTLREWLAYLTEIDEYVKVIEMLGDVSHVVLYNFPAIPLAKMQYYCRKHRIRCLADVTEWYSSKGQGLVYAIIKGFDTFLRMRVLHPLCDGLIVISEYLARYYSDCQSVVIPPLVDTSEEKWNHPYEKDKNRLRLVYAGSPGRKDRIDILLEAASLSSRDIVVDVVGVSLDDYISIHPEHGDIITKLGERIQFHGRLTHVEALEYVRHANYSCFFRIHDRVSMAGFPTKFVEAVSLSTPVLTNDTSDLTKYCNGSSNGYIVFDLSPSAIASVLDSIPFSMPVDSKLFDYRKYKSKLNELV